MSNGEFLSVAYGQKPQYYNTENTEKEKNKRKTSAIIKTLLITGGVAAAGIAGYKNKTKLNQLLDTGLKKLQNTEFYKKVMKNERFKKVKNSLDSVSNNFSNVKDDAYDSLREKMVNCKFKPIAFIGKKLTQMGNKMAEIYHNILKDASGKDYKTAYEKLKKLGLEKQVDDYDTWYKKVSEEIQGIHDNNKRITKGFLRNRKFKEFHKKTFANELLDASEKLNKLGQEVKINNLTNEQQEALNAFNKARSALFEKIKPKVRDIAWGNAATDTLISGSSLIPLAWSITTADTPEERKNTVFNLGIPLLSGIAMNVFSTMKACSGAVGMIVGFVGGKILTTGISKTVDILEKQKENLEKELKA